jgi:tungstate transport system ATP-binding protein
MHGPLTSETPLTHHSGAPVSGAILPLSGHGLTLSLGGRRLLDGIDITVSDNGSGVGITTIMGPNGAGKSLLLRTLAGLIKPDDGTIHWNGAPPDRQHAHRLGFVFQKPVLLRRSVIANMLHALKAAGIKRSERSERAYEALEQANLSHLAKAPARVLSGGEQQRLALARALATKPELLMLDEPTASLDPTSTAAIEALVLDAASAGTRILFVTHDIGQARRLADDVMFLHDGRVAEVTAAKDFFDKPASHQAHAFLKGHLLV